MIHQWKMDTCLLIQKLMDTKVASQLIKIDDKFPRKLGI